MTVPAPAGEIGSGLNADYLAGFIRQGEGDLYHPRAYVDPFVEGFEAANRGAIIPVNAVPGRNQLEVWWFRRNQVNVTRGFQNSYWPAVIGRYTSVYPSMPAEIVLASDNGSGPLQASRPTAVSTRTTLRCPATIRMRNTPSCRVDRPSPCAMTSTSLQARDIPRIRSCS